MLFRSLQLGPGDTVLDLGCGSGRTLVWNADTGASLTGVDISPFFSREALERAELVLGDVRRLPIADAAFTKAWSLDVFEHVSLDALREVLGELHRVLAPGGVVFVYTHVRKNGPLGWAVRAVNRLAAWCERAGLIDLGQERLRKSDHVNPLTDHDHLHRVAAECGFSIERLTYYTPVIGALTENVVARIVEHLMTRRVSRRVGDAAEATKEVRAAAKRRVRASGPTYVALRLASAVMMLDVALFGRVKSGPFFALLRKN